MSTPGVITIRGGGLNTVTTPNTTYLTRIVNGQIAIDVSGGSLKGYNGAIDSETCKSRIVAYRDNGGSPSELIAVSNEKTGWTNADASPNTYTFPSSFRINAGEPVWFGLIVDSAINIQISFFVSTSPYYGPLVYSNTPYDSGAPSNWVTAGSLNYQQGISLIGTYAANVVGYSDLIVQTGTGNSGANSQYLSDFVCTAGADFTVHTGYIYFNQTDLTARIKIVVYADLAGTNPQATGTPIAISDELQGVVPGWNAFKFSTPWTAVSGTRYWIGYRTLTALDVYIHAYYWYYSDLGIVYSDPPRDLTGNNYANSGNGLAAIFVTDALPPSGIEVSKSLSRTVVKSIGTLASKSIARVALRYLGIQSSKAFIRAVMGVGSGSNTSKTLARAVLYPPHGQSVLKSVARAVIRIPLGLNYTKSLVRAVVTIPGLRQIKALTRAVVTSSHAPGLDKAVGGVPYDPADTAPPFFYLTDQKPFGTSFSLSTPASIYSIRLFADYSWVDCTLQAAIYSANTDGSPKDLISVTEGYSISVNATVPAAVLEFTFRGDAVHLLAGNYVLVILATGSLLPAIGYPYSGINQGHSWQAVDITTSFLNSFGQSEEVFVYYTGQNRPFKPYLWAYGYFDELGPTGDIYYTEISSEHGKINDTINLKGVGFSFPEVHVFLGDYEAQIDYITDMATDWNFIVPPIPAGSYPLRLVWEGGSYTSQNFTVDVAIPEIYSITPSKGSTAGGTEVIIEGNGLWQDIDKVIFDDLVVIELILSDLTIYGEGSIRCTTPAHVAGVVNVRVGNASGGISVLKNNVSDVTFEYVNTPIPPPPTIIRIVPNVVSTINVTITVYGTNLATTTRVELFLWGILIATEKFTVINDTTITFIFDAEVVDGRYYDLKITTLGGTAFYASAILCKLIPPKSDATLFLMHTDETVQPVGIEAGSSTDKVILKEPPKLPLVVDHSKVKTKFILIPAVDPNLAKIQHFLVIEKQPSDDNRKFTVQIKAVNYDAGYYANDQDNPGEDTPPGGNLPPGNNTALDLVFICDTTGSMWGRVAALADAIIQYVSYLQSKKVNGRFGIVTFGDSFANAYDPVAKGANQASHNGFDFYSARPACDLTDATSFIAAVQAMRYTFGLEGLDEQENPLGALVYARTNFSFRPDAVKVYIVITDHPAHQIGDGDVESGWDSRYIPPIGSELAFSLRNEAIVHTVTVDWVYDGYYRVRNLSFATGGTWIELPGDGLVSFNPLPLPGLGSGEGGNPSRSGPSISSVELVATGYFRVYGGGFRAVTGVWFDDLKALKVTIDSDSEMRVYFSLSTLYGDRIYSEILDSGHYVMNVVSGYGTSQYPVTIP